MKPFVLAVVFAGVLSGQSADTAILGTVNDQNGVAVAVAAVMIRNQAIGFSKSVITGPDGQYRSEPRDAGGSEVQFFGVES
jgi:hypothetical protein